MFDDLGKRYLQYTLNPVFAACSQSLPVFSILEQQRGNKFVKVAGSDCSEYVERVTSSFLNSIFDTVNRCPVQLREVLSVILDEIKVKFGNKSNKILARIYFKDFISPIISNCLEYNLIDPNVAGNYFFL